MSGDTTKQCYVLRPPSSVMSYYFLLALSALLVLSCEERTTESAERISSESRVLPFDATTIWPQIEATRAIVDRPTVDDDIVDNAVIHVY
jgi:hypothetical protein